MYCGRLAYKLTNIRKSSKVYWSLLKTFLSNKRIPLIPLWLHEIYYITDFKEKVKVFDSFFLKQCTLIENYSKLPANLRYATDRHLSTVSFSAKVTFNQFTPNAPFLYPLKTSENLTIFWCFQWVQKGCINL